MVRLRLVWIALGCAAGSTALFLTNGVAAPVPKEGTTPYVRWTAEAKAGETEMNEPVVVKDLVVAGTGKGELRAYRIDTGEPAWTYKHGTRIYRRPATDGDRVFFAAEGVLAAVTAATGAKVWAFDLDKSDAPPVLAVPERGLVVAADYGGTVYAVDAKTGAKRWTADVAADAPPDPPGFDGAQARFANTKARPTALSTDGETVFVSVFDQCRVVAFSAATGERLWAYQTRGWLHGAAAVTPAYVFVGSQDKCFYCLDKRTGKVRWKFETKGRISDGGAVDEQFVYFGSCDGAFYCLGQSDGKQRWRFETDRKPDGKPSAIYSVPVLQRGGVHFAAAEGQFYAVSADTGALRWKLRPAAGCDLYCSPATDGRSFFVASQPRGRNGESAGVPSLVAISLK